ncbi:MAG TPA: nucleotidyltransferase domain-containing protein, partial [Candidatus Korarchaeota archaeon]|nr:nucleotidyltransferase domain-containing protein [Candidatus Korarchaeota archaeon]
MGAKEALNLPGDIEKAISKLIEEVKESCESILLTGSYAIGKQRRGSDIDLFFITRGERESERVRAIAERYKRALGKTDWIRPLLDYMVLTYRELLDISTKERNFYIYSCFKKGKVIYGR